MGGGGGSESSTTQTTDQSTNISETITTTLGDVGLTGKDAVNLADVVQGGVVAQTKLLSDLVSPVLTTQAALVKKLAENEYGEFDVAAGTDGEELPEIAAAKINGSYVLIAAAIGAFALIKYGK